MQSAIILAVMVLASFFAGAEYLRGSSTDANLYKPFKAENVAANILQYQDQINGYILDNYDDLHLSSTLDPGNIEKINLLDYGQNNIGSYTLKNLSLFLNYSSVVFNYTRAIEGESEPYPMLYLATSWDSYSSNVHGYKNIQMEETLGQLSQDVSKSVYQGNSTFWVVPWVFKQSNCNIIEMYSQLPNDASGASTFNKLQSLFNLFCTQIEKGS